MFKILTLNNISAKGLERFPRDKYEVASEIQQPDAIILRSFKMHGRPIPGSLQAVGRAGAGVNNIPVEEMTARGIPVFNAPGANANAVKELVLIGMLLAARNICQAWAYTRELQGDDNALSQQVEAGKKKYVGYELPGKTLAVIGLGAIGVKVANAAVALGMRVVGYDPAITVENAWKLSAEIAHAATVDEALHQADFVTFHVPLLDATRNMLNADRLCQLRQGAVVLNMARGGIVDDAAVLAALVSGQVSAYVCDFPSKLLQDKQGVIALPHLGASTGEAEENCAVMVADQLKEFMEYGHIKNSVNFPTVSLPCMGVQRISIVNENRPDMLGQVSHILGKGGVNICHMVNESRGGIAYTLVDVETLVDAEAVDKLKAIDGVLRVRLIAFE